MVDKFTVGDIVRRNYPGEGVVKGGTYVVEYSSNGGIDLVGIDRKHNNEASTQGWYAEEHFDLVEDASVNGETTEDETAWQTVTSEEIDTLRRLGVMFESRDTITHEVRLY